MLGELDLATSHLACENAVDVELIALANGNLTLIYGGRNITDNLCTHHGCSVWLIILDDFDTVAATIVTMVAGKVENTILCYVILQPEVSSTSLGECIFIILHHDRGGARLTCRELLLFQVDGCTHLGTRYLDQISGSGSSLDKEVGTLVDGCVFTIPLACTFREADGNTWFNLHIELAILGSCIFEVFCALYGDFVLTLHSFSWVCYKRALLYIQV